MRGKRRISCARRGGCLYRKAIMSESEACSTVVGEASLQSLSCEEYSALDRSERKLHVVRDLVVLVSGHVHGEGYAVLFWERLDSRSDFVDSERAFGSLEAGILREVEVVQVLGAVDNGRRAYNAPVVVDEYVSHYCEYPSLEVSVVHVLVLVVKDLQGSVLEQVVSIIAVRGQGVGEIEHVTLEVHQSCSESGGSHNSDNLGLVENRFCQVVVVTNR